MGKCNRQVKKLRRLLQQRRSFKISIRRLFHIGERGFYLKAENERFTAVRTRCCTKLKSEVSWRRLGNYVKEMYLDACCTNSTIICIQPIINC